MDGDYISPKCRRCRRNAMQIQRDPFAACAVAAPLLPFDELKPTPAKSQLRSLKERAS
jgi:hypothetical protein